MTLWRKKRKRADLLVPKALGLMLYSKGPARSELHKDRIRELGCMLTGYPHPVAHHVRCIAAKTGFVRPSDYLLVPLRHDLHDPATPGSLHHGGDERAWWSAHNVDPAKWINFALRQMYEQGANEDAELAIELTGGWPT